MVDLSLLEEKPNTQQLKETESEDELLGQLIGSGNESTISDVERVVCFFVAKGDTYETACQKLGLEDSVAENMKQRQELFQLVLNIQTALRLSVPDQLRALAPTALQRKMELVMFSKNENVVNAATSFIIEQAVGRATQKVEVQSFNLNASMEVKEIDDSMSAAMKRLEQLENEQKRIKDAKLAEKAS